LRASGKTALVSLIVENAFDTSGFVVSQRTEPQPGLHGLGGPGQERVYGLGQLFYHQDEVDLMNPEDLDRDIRDD
jgi:hypothetical protein